MSGSFIDIELDAAGKQFGWLRIEHSSDRSAWGIVPVPVVVVSGSAGPTVLLLSGSHGDEYEGQIILSRLIERIRPDEVTGRLIVMPAANVQAVVAGRRVSPHDGGNLNRSFGADPAVTVADKIAGVIARELLPIADAVVDLHSGGESLELMPCCMGGLISEPELDRKTEALLAAFGAPLSLVFKAARSGGGNLSEAARAIDVPALTTELGGGGGVRRDGIEVGAAGVMGVLHHLGVVPGVPRPPRTRRMRIDGAGTFTFVFEAGVFEPAVALGDTVSAGQIVGTIHSPEEPKRTPRDVVTSQPGFVYAMRAIGRVAPGDCVLRVATPE